MLKLLVEDIMTTHPIKVKDHVPVRSVAHLLLRYRINGILVVRKDNEHAVVGVFTTTDLLRLINQALGKRRQKLRELQKLANLPVGKVASRRVFVLQKNDRVIKAIAVMHKKNIHTIPVYDRGVLVGVVGKHDVLNIALT